MKTIIILNRQRFGIGDEDLGDTLIAAFLRKIWASNTKPAAIIFYHAGVHLLKKNSPILDILKSLETAGVDLIACGTCIGYYDIEDKLAIGRKSDMGTIVSILMTADKVISP